MSDTSCLREMPKYQSHKQVWALKIKAIDGRTITPAEEGFGPFSVSAKYLEKHKPQVGGYFVEYEGGYKSFSPADAFEAGNTLIGKPVEDIRVLLTFYSAGSLSQLIAEQSDHIRQLQQRLAPFLKEPQPFIRVREG
ncbi:hypothetical protein BK645_10050 [Pseudomonas protegens]|uniref:hypothetical protein n=1 Tax=Pseudomonas protegens TaxID=380021 RepID=UPI000368773A|nr:hypothetical protein [Pseudomonas protegens]ROM29302.1 hypothetical protein BK645_10050 [Pseudomonas protegens]ROM36935.1 hypothetical protein BK646_18095 [Pseudomonas protegens]